MISSSEKDELIAIQKRLGELLPRIEALPKTCDTCCEMVRGWCKVHLADVPLEFRINGCDKWDWNDIPF